MTWEKLKERIEEMDEQQLTNDVTIHLLVSDEYLGNVMMGVTGDYDDVLDRNSPFLAIEF